MCLLLDYIIKTISFQLFEPKINKLEKIRQSKVNPDVKNEINIYLLIKIIKTIGMKQPFEINKYIIDIKHKQNCIVPYTEIKLTTTTTIILCSVSFHEYFDIHLKFSNVAIRISTYKALISMFIAFLHNMMQIFCHKCFKLKKCKCKCEQLQGVQTKQVFNINCL